MTEMTKKVQKIVLQAREGPRSFRGYVVVDLSLDPAMVIDPPSHFSSGPRYRWTDMSLYRVKDPQVSAMYVVYVVGRSVLYHRPEGSCRKGVMSTVGSLVNDVRYELLRPCREPECYPAEPWDFLEDLEDGDRVAVEQERYTLHKCADAQDVIEQLSSSGGVMSSLSMKLLQEAALEDSDIAAALMRERPL